MTPYLNYSKQPESHATVLKIFIYCMIQMLFQYFESSILLNEYSFQVVYKFPLVSNVSISFDLVWFI